MQKLYEDELSLIEGQKGQCDAVHDRWEKHAEDKAVEEWLLSNKVADGCYVKAEAIAQYDLFKVFILDEKRAHFVGKVAA